MLRTEDEIRIRRKDWLAMQAHVESMLPEEACGFVASLRNCSTAVYPIENITHRPDMFYMEGRQQVKALLAIKANNWDLLAIYHSHPAGSPSPSDLDYQGHYPECALLIWRPDLGGWRCRAYRLSDHKNFVEVPLTLLLK